MMEAEIKQLSEESVRLAEKMANDDAKMTAHRMEKEKISEELQSALDDTNKTKQEFATLEEKHTSLTEQLIQIKAKEAELLQLNGPMRSAEEIKVEAAEGEGTPTVLIDLSNDVSLNRIWSYHDIESETDFFFITTGGTNTR